MYCQYLPISNAYHWISWMITKKCGNIPIATLTIKCAALRRKLSWNSRFQPWTSTVGFLKMYILETQVNAWLKQSEKDSFPASMKIKLQYISYGIMVSYHIPHQQSLKWKNPNFSPPLSLPSPVVFGSGAGNTSPWLRSLWGAALGEHNEMIRWSVIVKEFAEPF